MTCKFVKRSSFFCFFFLLLKKVSKVIDIDSRDRDLGKHTVNFGIGGDKVEDVDWPIGNLNANKEVRYVVLICATNSINKNVPESIVKGIKHTIQIIKCKLCYSKVSRILPREYYF